MHSAHTYYFSAQTRCVHAVVHLCIHRLSCVCIFVCNFRALFPCFCFSIIVATTFAMCVLDFRVHTKSADKINLIFLPHTRFVPFRPGRILKFSFSLSFSDCSFQNRFRISSRVPLPMHRCGWLVVRNSNSPQFTWLPRTDGGYSANLSVPASYNDCNLRFATESSVGIRYFTSSFELADAVRTRTHTLFDHFVFLFYSCIFRFTSSVIVIPKTRRRKHSKY